MRPRFKKPQPFNFSKYKLVLPYVLQHPEALLPENRLLFTEQGSDPNQKTILDYVREAFQTLQSSNDTEQLLLAQNFLYDLEYGHLVENYIPQVRIDLASNPNTPSYILSQLYFDTDFRVRIKLASNPNTDKDTLYNLSFDSVSCVVKELHSNPNYCPDYNTNKSRD